MMLLRVSQKPVSYTAKYIDINDPKNRRRREQVENAATVTGGVGAGAAATRGGAMKFFQSAGRVKEVSRTAVKTTNALQVPVKQTNSLWNALKLNKIEFFNKISKWAEASKMPKFMKGIFTGKFGKFIGGGAAVFVFITGIGEVISTASNNLYRLGATASLGNNN